MAQGGAGERGVDDEALRFLATRAGGDARTALQALELAAATAGEGAPVTLALAEDALQRRAVRFDKRGDQHYDTISAWIKATRGSDPDASLYYLAVMLEGGEDPRFIARRMVILASEDIGNADPQALPLAVATAQAVEHVGMPEARVGARAVRDLPEPRAEVEGGLPRDRPRPRQRARARRAAAARLPALRRLPGREASSGAATATTTRTRTTGHLSGQELLPDALVGERFYRPDDGRGGAARAPGGDPPRP